MKNFFIAFLVFLVWSFFGLWVYSWFHDVGVSSIRTAKSDTTLALNLNDTITNDEKKIDTKERSFRSDSTTNTIKKPLVSQGLKAINSKGDVVFIYDEGIKIVKNSATISIPESCIDYKYKINSYLLDHPDKELQIIGLYSPNEEVQFPNYGIQRANKIKQELLLLDIPEDKIVTKSIISPIFVNDSIHTNAIRFLFKTLNRNRVEDLKTKIPEKETIYPKFSGSEILVTEELENVLKKILTFTAVNPNLKITVIGHTDTIGNATDNYWLGLKYARQVRWYLIAKGGLKKSQVTAISKGETLPITDNIIQQGRKTNNRIEIIFN